jgi:lipoyl-dependent peroxiredoxin
VALRVIRHRGSITDLDALSSMLDRLDALSSMLNRLDAGGLIRRDRGAGLRERRAGGTICSRASALSHRSGKGHRMAVIYQTSATSTGDGRSGHVRSVDGVIDTDLAVPKEMGGVGGALPNPEEFFAAGYAACFHSALRGVARRQRITLNDDAVTVDVGIGPRDEGGFGLTVAIEAELPGVEETKARELLDAAHQVCPYSNATRGNIDVKISLA